jgi:hypothetical protein
VLIFSKYAGVETSTLTIFNISFNELKNPDAVIYSLYLVFLYFLVRYYQFFSQEGYKEIKNAFAIEINDVFRRKVYQITLKEGAGSSYVLEEDDRWAFQVFVSGGDGLGGESEREKKRFKLSKNMIIRIYIRSIAHITTSTSMVTDYIFPIFLGIATIFYKLLY